MLIFDAHLDLSLDALEHNRDLRQPIAEIRAREMGLRDKQGRANGTVCFPEMRRGGVGLCVATQIARYVKPGNPLPGWNSPEQAWAQTQGQLARYRAMEAAGHLIQIRDRPGLEAQWEVWRTGEAHRRERGALRHRHGFGRRVRPRAEPGRPGYDRGNRALSGAVSRARFFRRGHCRDHAREFSAVPARCVGVTGAPAGRVGNFADGSTFALCGNLALFWLTTPVRGFAVAGRSA